MDVDLIRKQLDNGLINASVLLSGTKLLDESSRECADYYDNRYLPFYYHLGKQLTPKSVCQIGSKLGLIGACFMRSCKTVEQWSSMDHDRDFTAGIITSNLKLHATQCSIGYVGLNEDVLIRTCSKKVDLVFLTENFGEQRYREHLEFLWKYLRDEGLLVADYIRSHDVFQEFCRVKNRTPEIFDTRYGIGIIHR